MEDLMSKQYNAREKRQRRKRYLRKKKSEKNISGTKSKKTKA